MRWRRSLGAGFAAVSVVGDALFTSADADSRETVFRFHAETGEEVWRFVMDEAFEEEFGNGPRSTPTVHRDTVFALSSRGGLYALDSRSGKKRWGLDLPEATGNRKAEFRGYSSSPLVVGKLLVLNLGPADETALVGLDAERGRLLWGTGRGRASFSSPIPVKIDGQPMIVGATGHGLIGLTPHGGEILWRYRWKTKYELNVATPVHVPPDNFLISSGYDKGSALVSVHPGEEGWTVHEHWTNRLFRNHFHSSVYHEGQFYGFDNSILKCIDAATGEERWAHRGFGKGTLIYADGMLIVLGDEGTLGLVEARPDAYHELATAPVLTGRSWTAPSLADGRLYLRDHSEMVSIDLRGPEWKGPETANAQDAG